MQSTSINVRIPFLFIGALAFTPAVVLGLTGAGSYASPWLIASVMIASGVLCTVAASLALQASVRVGFVENALVAGALVSSGLFVLLHGVVSPGAIFDATDSAKRVFGASGQLAAAVAIPPLAYLLLLTKRRDESNSWRMMSIGMPLVGVALGILLVAQDSLRALKPETIGVTILVVLAVGIQVAVALHFTQLARRFGDRYSQQMGLALLLNSGVPIFFYFGGPGSGAYWWAHGLCMAGVGFGAVAIWLKAREATVVSQLVGSIVTTKPMQSLGVDLSPAVVARLREIKDPLDPRLAVALRAGEKLADMKDDQKLEAEVLLPIFQTTLESLAGSAAPS